MTLRLPLCVHGSAEIHGRRHCTHHRIRAPHGVGYPECVTCDFRLEPEEDKWIRHRVPCAHRGEQVARPECGCKIYACSIHGQCSPQNNLIVSACCLTCDSYTIG